MQNEKVVKTEVEAVVPPAETKKIVREFLKPSDFARSLGVSKAYIIKEINRGNIKAVKLISGQYRIPRSEYDRYVDGLEKPKELVLPVPVAERVSSTPIPKYEEEPTTTAGKLAAPPKILEKIPKKEVVKMEAMEEEEIEEEAPKPKPKKRTVVKKAKPKPEPEEEEEAEEKDEFDEMFE